MDATGSSGRPWMAVPERSDRHDVAAEGTAKRREDGPAAAEVLWPALNHAPGSRGAAASTSMLNRAIEKAATLRK